MKLSNAEGFAYSEPRVYPSNWKSTRANIKIAWLIHYRFYEVGGPVKQVKIKGMNRYHNLKERQRVTAGLLAQELEMLKDLDYNPIANKINNEEATDYLIDPQTPFISALQAGIKEMHGEPETKRDAGNVISHIATAARQLRFDKTPVSDIKRRHIIAILKQCGQNKGKKWTANNFNVYRKNLMMIYKVLIQLETVEFNPVREIVKQKVTKKVRETLSKQQREPVITYLKNKHYRFWVYTNIFFHSGSRTRELLRLTGKDIDLPGQRFKITVKKGKQATEDWRPIKDIAVPFWEIALQGCGPTDFIFSKRLKPGTSMLRADQITKRWARIKKIFGITADFYAFKHSNLDETAMVLSIQQAQKMAGHSSQRTTRLYAVGQEGRESEELKSVYNPL